MSYTQRLANAAYGVTNFLRKQGFDVSGSGKKANDIMVGFLKSKKIRYRPWSANQKHSLKTADMYNAETIQDHWREFKDYITKLKNET